MIQENESISLEEVVYAGFVELIRSEQLVDDQWLARITASPETIFELLLELIHHERCPKKRAQYRKVKVEERMQHILQLYKCMGDMERAKFSDTIIANKLFLVP